VTNLPEAVDAVTKLAGVVLSGFGAVRLLEPWQKKRLAKATAEEMKVLARAEIDVQKIRLQGQKEIRELEAKLLPPAPTLDVVVDAELVPDSETTPLLLSRVRERSEFQEAKRQFNVEQISLEAVNELRGQEASGEPVDEDWVARFFEAAKDISSEQMQQIWARILAGEVKQPGSFSLRCIEAVRNTSRREAKMFEELSPYVVSNRFILRTVGDSEKTRNARLQDALQLGEAGLLTVDMQLSFSPTFAPAQSTALLMNDLVIVVVSRTEKERKENFSAYILTSVGMELMRLFPRPADRGYARALVEKLRKSNYEVRTLLGVRHGDGLKLVSDVDLFPPDPPKASVPPPVAEPTEPQVSPAHPPPAAPELEQAASRGSQDA
jgi:hypothetical protein